jgi:hypothetical protein
MTQVAAETELGHRDRAMAAFEDFKAAIPDVATLSQIKKWMYPAADLYGFKPLYEGSRLAGIND